MLKTLNTSGRHNMLF